MNPQEGLGDYLKRYGSLTPEQQAMVRRTGYGALGAAGVAGVGGGFLLDPESHQTVVVK